jgi:hypothetical protein
MEWLDLMATCTARSKQTGKRCRRPAIPGGTVCFTHGGGAPQVRAAARVRLAALVDPSINVLDKLLKRQKKEPAIAFRAAVAVLDRNGFGPTTKIIGAGEDGAITIQLDVSAKQDLESRINSLIAEAKEVTVLPEPN